MGKARGALVDWFGWWVVVVGGGAVQWGGVGGAGDLGGAVAGLNEIVARFRIAGVAGEGLVWSSVNRSLAEGLINAITEYQPSLVVLPDDRPTGLWRLTRQSVCEAVGREVGCAVLVVP